MDVGWNVTSAAAAAVAGGLSASASPLPPLPPMPELPFCRRLVIYPKVGRVGVTLFINGTTAGVAGISVLIFLLYRRHRAHRGDAAALSSLVLPIYYAIMLCLPVLDVILALTVTLVEFAAGNQANPVGRSILYGFLHGVFEFFIAFVSVFLLHRGAGWRAVRRSLAIAALWGSIVTVLKTLSLVFPDPGLSIGLNIVWRGFLVIFFFALLILPERICYQRPAMRRSYWAHFWFVCQLYLTISLLIQLKGWDSGYCIYLVGLFLFFNASKSFVVYNALRIDSAYWQGIALRAPVHERLASKITSFRSSIQSGEGRRPSSPSLHGEPRESGAGTAGEGADDIRTPLLGTTFEADTAKQLAATLEQLDGSDIRLLNYGFLSISLKHTLGGGARAKVFRGHYVGQPVAIKMVMCMEVTPEVIASFAREATLLARMAHPNIVAVYGVAVAPPALCLVMELCRCDLFDYLRSNEGLTLSVRQRMLIALDCATAIAFLHNRRCVHADIKSLNFLISCCKQASASPQRDAERASALRCSRGSTSSQRASPRGSRSSARGSVVQVPAPLKLTEAEARSSAEVPIVKVTDLELSTENNEAVASSVESVTWTAPELLDDENAVASTQTDVYGLGLVFWEIFHPGHVPFDELLSDSRRNHWGEREQAARMIKDGYRPPLAATVPPAMQALVQHMWAEEPTGRPDAAAVVEALEGALAQHRAEQGCNTPDFGEL